MKPALFLTCSWQRKKKKKFICGLQLGQMFEVTAAIIIQDQV